MKDSFSPLGTIRTQYLTMVVMLNFLAKWELMEGGGERLRVLDTSLPGILTVDNQQCTSPKRGLARLSGQYCQATFAHAVCLSEK